MEISRPGTPAGSGSSPAARARVNGEEIQCLWREEGLRVPQRRQHKTPRPLGTAARILLRYPPAGGRGITAYRTPYFTV
jgi:hypothetical protein